MGKWILEARCIRPCENEPRTDTVNLQNTQRQTVNCSAAEWQDSATTPSRSSRCVRREADSTGPRAQRKRRRRRSDGHGAAPARSSNLPEVFLYSTKGVIHIRILIDGHSLHHLEAPEGKASPAPYMELHEEHHPFRGRDCDLVHAQIPHNKPEIHPNIWTWTGVSSGSGRL